MRRPARIAMLVLIFGSSSLAAEPRPPTAAGRWQIAISRPGTGCRWFGSVAIEQRGVKLTGRGAARRVEGRACPSPLQGRISGSVQGRRVRFGFAFGPLGDASFVGELDPRGAGMSGSWTTSSANGTWAAAR